MKNNKILVYNAYCKSNQQVDRTSQDQSEAVFRCMFKLPVKRLVLRVHNHTDSREFLDALAVVAPRCRSDRA